MTQKLDVGNVLTRTFQTYRDQFTLLIPAALVLFVPVALLNALIISGGGVLAALIAAAVGIVATYWFQGMVVEAVRDILDGRRDHSVGSLFRSAAPVVAPLIGAGLLAGLAIGIGLILLIVPGLILLTIWAVIAPVIVVERTGVFQAFGRSRQLVRGHGWQVFGVIVVLFLLQVAVSAVVQAILVGVADSFIGYFFADLIVRVLVAPLAAIAAAVMYFELKARHGEPLPEMAGAAAPAGVGQGAGAPAAPTPQQPPAAPQPPAPPQQQPGGAEIPGGQPTAPHKVPDQPLPGGQPTAPHRVPPPPDQEGGGPERPA